MLFARRLASAITPAPVHRRQTPWVRIKVRTKDSNGRVRKPSPVSRVDSPVKVKPNVVTSSPTNNFPRPTKVDRAVRISREDAATRSPTIKAAVRAAATRAAPGKDKAKVTGTKATAIRAGEAIRAAAKAAL
jgi:hypothetical protein